ncbi:MAG: helix-turn-helix transcriptional regulator [Lachnospiraceae bacterium]|nr:helix-turn-helix transcriptional regulator [Lachnospiraceae bacterium]
MLSLNYNIGDRIRYFREKAGLTQKQLGELTGKSESAIRNYELDNRTPDWETLTRLANALKVSYYALDASSIDRTFKVAHMLFEMESLYGLTPYIDRNGDVYLKFSFDMRAYREILEKYEDQEESDGEYELTEEDKARIDKICGSVISPESAVDLDNAIYAWALALRAKEKGLVDDQTYDDWKYKYPVFANIDDDGKPEIYEENQALIRIDTND